MLFSSLEFLYLFLPLTLGAYYLCPSRGRNALLLVFSLLFYCLGGLSSLPLILLTVALSFFFGLRIGSLRKKGRLGRLPLILGIVSVLSLLCFFK